MKIAHLCLSCFYIDGYSYQENELVRMHVKLGHEVIVIASTESYDADRQRVYLKPSTYMGEEGARVIRLPYRSWLPLKIMRKLRMHPGVGKLLEGETPDLIFFHGLCGWELWTVAKYGRRNPETRLIVDSHEDANNSARGFLSRYLLHGLYYRTIIRASLDAFEKVLCISLETIAFCRDRYQIPDKLLEFFPLGGYVYNDNEYNERRRKMRRELGLSDDEILILQTGKIGPKKKLAESLSAFKKTTSGKLHMAIAGEIEETIRSDLMRSINEDSRIRFLGWKSNTELQDLLCAADVYLQPGTQSVTMQMSLCARCAIIVDDVPSHHAFLENNGSLVSDQRSLESAIQSLEDDPLQVIEQCRNSHRVAERLLHYPDMAQRILQPNVLNTCISR